VNGISSELLLSMVLSGGQHFPLNKFQETDFLQGCNSWNYLDLCSCWKGYLQEETATPELQPTTT
jgi:hypothetical protein